MLFDSLCQLDRDGIRELEFDAVVRAGPWALATFDGLLARNPMPFSAVLVHDSGAALSLAFERLSVERNQMAVIPYRESIDPARVVDALHMGAVDYLAWPLDPANLPDRLQLAAARSAQRLRNTERLSIARKRFSTLSQREFEVLTLLAQGSSTKDMARDLGISPRTVEIHRSHMMGKLGVSSAAHAAAIGAQYELLNELPGSPQRPGLTRTS